jgi:hypothetical protein
LQILIRNKTKMTSIIVIVLLMASATLMAMPVQPAKAQLSATQPTSGSLPSGVTVDVTHDTQCYLAIRPNPIGVGQSLLVTMWINPAFASNNRFAPDGFKVTLTKPDGTTEVFTLDSEPATAAIWFEYYPDQVGEWKIKVDYLGTYFPAGRYLNGYIITNNTGGAVYGSAYYKPSSAPEETVTVQTDMVYSWPPAALPTDYWTRPASLNNREWWPILGNYPGDGYVGGGAMWDELYPDTNPHDSFDRYNFIPWVTGPESAHIVWKQQNAIAGLIGGMAGQYGVTSSPGNPTVVYAGRCYQTVTKITTQLVNGTYRQLPGSVAQCYDLRTGEIYYEIPTADGGVTPSYLGYLSPAQDALATSTWSVELLTISGGRLLKINPWTGAVTTNVSISPLTGTGGFYYMNNYVLSLQNIGNTTVPNYRLINWTTIGSGITLVSRVASNITWPWSTYPNQYSAGVGICTADFNVGIASLVTRVTEAGSGIYWGINVSAASLITGQLLPWSVKITDETTYSGSCATSDHGKVAFLTQTGVWMAYDLQTGKLAWKSERMAYPYGAPSFGAYAVQSAYGMLFRQSYDGVYAFNWTNGKIVWKYAATAPASFESPYAVDGQEIYPFNSGGYIADGKMYVSNTEHTPSWPRTRGWSLHCINITTGEGIWRITGEQTPGAIVDGYLTAANSWDGYMYVYGKGKSATTVEAPLTALTLGQSLVIQGTVLDMSPAQAGTPCVSKGSMTTQMEYLHMQQPIGGIWGNETITGVPVTLIALDANGNYQNIGTATTNGYYGTFSISWTPPIEGDYTIMASFAGDESYGSSGAATAITVGPAPTTAPTQEPQQMPPDSIPYIIGIGIAIIIAIAIVGILILRKRA